MLINQNDSNGGEIGPVKVGVLGPPHPPSYREMPQRKKHQLSNEVRTMKKGSFSFLNRCIKPGVCSESVVVLGLNVVGLATHVMSMTSWGGACRGKGPLEVEDGFLILECLS